MKLVIDIPEDVYKDIQRGTFSFRDIPLMSVAAIKNGTPLPKGHGRLIDGNAVWEKLKDLEERSQTQCLNASDGMNKCNRHGVLHGITTSKFIVQDAPTIIEAQSEDAK